MKGLYLPSYQIKAIQEHPEREWQTRRIAKFVPLKSEQGINLAYSGLKLGDYCTGAPESGKVLYTMRDGCWNQVTERLFPHYHVGEVVYVKEAWASLDEFDAFAPRDIPSDYPIYFRLDTERYGSIGKWRSPRFMPAWAARLFMKVLDVRPERLQEITKHQEDAMAEGVIFMGGIGDNFDEAPWADPTDPEETPFNFPSAAYGHLWNTISPKYPWSTNPWVFCYVLKVVPKSEEEK